ncbi:MAG: DUF1080 domain-containing protein, partial [Flavitalea sp.]
MRTIFAAALMAAVVAGCHDPETNGSALPAKEEIMPDSTTNGIDNMLSEAEKIDGFELLFDGVTKSGFHVYNQKTDGSAWSVVDGTIHLDPKEVKDSQTSGGGDLVSADEYENFHLKLDWRIDTAGNSGILIYVKESPEYERSWHTGMEVQVLDNAKHPDAKIIKHRAGDLYDLISASQETVKPALEWNQVEIISNNGLLECSLNGVKVISTTLWDGNWKALIEGSKFKK